MRLEILISTYGSDGIRRLSSPGVLPRVDDVAYLVSWQRGGCDDAVPDALSCREDVRVVEAPGRGLGANRDNALRHASGEICLLSDDDLEYHPDGLRALIDRMDRYPEIGYALVCHDGGDNRYYPAGEYQLDKMAKGHFVNEIDVAFRLDKVRAAGVGFDHRFGVGSEYPSGEGYVWLAGLRRKGLTGRYFPIVTATHPGLTTNERMVTDYATMRSEGVLVALLYPWSGVLRTPLVAWRRSCAAHVSWGRVLVPMTRGYIHGLRMRKSLLPK